jgi:ADP-heptose:LPS heptosyltransferase
MLLAADVIRNDPDLYKFNCENARLCGLDWVKGISNVNTVIPNKEEAPIEIVEKIKRPLFVQHSSAGDVFMTTRCFKGLYERYGSKLDYMTMPQFKDIIEGNPYIHKVLDYDEQRWSEYQYVINPHRERILPGHWGRNSNSILSDFYWKLLGVEPCDFYIQEYRPRNGAKITDTYQHLSGFPRKVDLEVRMDSRLAIVHTTGGAPRYRTYKFMEPVVLFLMKNGYNVVQLGGENDYLASEIIDPEFDLRGKLTFNESAWVMSHAKVAVTVDSFVSHLAGAYGVDQVCLFGSGNANVVKPKQVKGRLICLSPDYIKHCPGLGPCSGIIDCPVPCTGRHDPKTIIEALKELI